MKYIDMKIGEYVELNVAGESVKVIAQQRSGNYVRLAIQADKAVDISNNKSLADDGLVDIVR